jgi:hypothetical protein
MNWASPACTDALAPFRSFIASAAKWGRSHKALLLRLLALLQLLAACASVPSQQQTPPGFIPLQSDPRVWYEPGGKAFAVEVSGLLDHAVARVEAVHGLPFLRPPRVYVCESTPCFHRLVPVPGYTAAVLQGGILVLSPKLDLEEYERLPKILEHELSHLHLDQRLGHYSVALPIWFHEGLASLVAEGGGAEFSSDEEACTAWDSGRRINFAQLDSPQMRYRAADFKVSIYQFYRQAWRFVQYLQRRDARAFTRMLHDIQAGKALTDAVGNAYNADLEQLSLEFDFDSR